MNSMKQWENVVIVDTVLEYTHNKCKFIFVPYVYPGRFQEALDTRPDWKLNLICIFAHQEFRGCKMGAIISEDGDKWPLEYPQVISGHIHMRQKPQENVYYSGSAMQHAFGESEKNIIACIEFSHDKYNYSLREVDLKLPRKKIVYLNVDDINEYKLPDTADSIKLTLSGNYPEFKALKKTAKFRELTDKGIKVIFKPTRQEIKNADEALGTCLEISKQTDSANFTDILDGIIKTQKDQYLFQAYELVINQKDVSEDDVIFL